MEFRYRGFSSQMQQNHLYRTPSASSPSNYTTFSDQALEGGIWRGISVGGGKGRSEIIRQLEKDRIREEILAAEEAQRRRDLEAEIRRKYMMEREMRGMESGGGFLAPSSLMLGHTDSHHHLHRFQPRMLHGQSYEPVDRRIAMSFQEAYGGTGRQPGELLGLMDTRTLPPFQDYGDSGRQLGELLIPVQPRRKIKEIITSPPKAGDTVFIGMGKPSGRTIMSGAKRKTPPPPAAAGSTELSNSSKKKTNEWSCALCEVTATSERGLHEHLAGKKHQAKEAELKAEHTGKSKKLVIKNSPESVKMDSSEDKKPEGENSGIKKFKFWCRMCKTGASTKKEMNMHKKGIGHLKNQLNLAQKSRGKAGGEGKKRSRLSFLPENWQLQVWCHM